VRKMGNNCCGARDQQIKDTEKALEGAGYSKADAHFYARAFQPILDMHKAVVDMATMQATVQKVIDGKSDAKDAADVTVIKKAAADFLKTADEIKKGMKDAEADAFKHADTTVDKKIDKTEFKAMLKSFYKAEKDVYQSFHDKMIAMWDSNADKKKEFESKKDKAKADTADALKALDGLIADADLAETAAPQPQWVVLFNQWDTDKDGTISASEFSGKLWELFRGDLKAEYDGWKVLFDNASKAEQAAAAKPAAAATAAPAATN